MVAPTILWRYILRDVLVHTSLGLALFSLVLVVQNVLRSLEELLAAELSAGILLQLAAMVLPSFMSYAIPTSLLFGVLITFGRMSADGEVVAMRASGISVPRLLPPVVALGVVCAAVMGYLLFELEPASRQRMKTFTRELSASVRLIETGRFLSIGDRTLYVAERGDETCPLRGILIGDFTTDRTVYISAECATIGPEREWNLALDLERGSIHFSDADPERYRRVGFQSMHVSLDISAILAGPKRGRDFTLAELFALKRRFARGEEPKIRGGNGERTVDTQIHRRLAFPLAPLLLGVLAVPLGIRPLRSGRSAGAITAVAVMALYWVVFTAGELVSERGWLPPWLGIWTANAIAAALAVYLIRATMRGES